MASVKCGTKLYKSLQIPINAIIKISPLGREYYVSGIDGNEMIIRYVDTGEFKRLPYYEKII